MLESGRQSTEVESSCQLQHYDRTGNHNEQCMPPATCQTSPNALLIDNSVTVTDDVCANDNPIAELSVSCYNTDQPTAEVSPFCDSPPPSGVSFSFSLELESSNATDCYISLSKPDVSHFEMCCLQSPVSQTSKCNLPTCYHDIHHCNFPLTTGELCQSSLATTVSEVAFEDPPSISANQLQFTRMTVINPDIALEQQSWYHGSLGRIEAEQLLKHQPEGSFLVRQSQSNKQDYCLSLKSAGGFLHIKIVCHDGRYILGQFSQPFDCVPHMVEFFCQAKLPIRGYDKICLIFPLANNPP
jgi:hypothetical protein